MSLSGRRGHDGHGSASLPLQPSSRRGAPDDEEDWQTPPQSMRGRYKRAKRDSSTYRSSIQASHRIVLKTRMDQTPDATSPAPPGAAHPVLNQFVNESPSAGQHHQISRRA